MADNLYHKPKELIRLLANKELFVSDSYFHEQNHHSSLYNYFYQVRQIIKYGKANEFYFMYGLDVKTHSQQREYVNYECFMKRRDHLNLSYKHNSSCLLRNKLYYDIFAKSLGIKVPDIIGFSINGKFYCYDDDNHNEHSIDCLLKKSGSYFCKETNGECGSGIFNLTVLDDSTFYINDKKVSKEDIAERLLKVDYIVQKRVSQHIQMQELYPLSINTIRLVTVRGLKDNQIHILPSILRIGSNGSIIDNTSKGGIAIGFDLQTGRLHDDGYMKPRFGRRLQVHPNTGIKFSDFVIPFIAEAEKEAIRFHSFLKDIHSIGWDIAIGKDGPIFIEGNDNWEINGPQVGNYGLRKEFKEYFYN